MWLVDRPSSEEMSDMSTGRKSSTKTSVDKTLRTRYNICVYVNDSYLDPLDGGLSPGPMVKLVWKEWVPQEIPMDGEIDMEMPPNADVRWTVLSVREYN